MKNLFKILCVLVLTALLLTSVPFTFATEETSIEDNWKVMGGKYAAGTRLIIRNSERTSVKFENFKFSRGDNGSINIDIPDYEEFKGVYPTAIVSSRATTPLDNLEVTMNTGENFTFTADRDLYSSSLNLLWTQSSIDKICNVSSRDGLFYADAVLDGIRSLAETSEKGLCVYITNNHSGYAETKQASTVAIVCFDGSFRDVADSQPGKRWWFRARNNRAQTAWSDSSGITQSFECIDITDGLTISIRPDSALGYVVVINGKEYYKGEDVAYFPNNTQIIEVDKAQNDYKEMADSWVNSITYAREDIDLSPLCDLLDGYLTLGLSGSTLTEGTDLFNFSIDTINAVPAAEWNGEANSHIHTPGEWQLTNKSVCAVNGVESILCTECSAVLEQRLLDYNEDAHVIGKWERRSDASKEAPGLDVRACIYHPDYIFEKRENPFTDIPLETWYTEACIWANEMGYMNGTAALTFAPKVLLDRAMVVKILAAIDGADLTPYEGVSTYHDVSASSWYTSAVSWATDNGVASGIGEGLFAPKTYVTRQQLATFLSAYAKYKGYDTESSFDLTTFDDVDDISSWAYDAFKWAVENAMISGTSDTTLSPKTITSRSQMAVIIRAYCDKFAN